MSGSVGRKGSRTVYIGRIFAITEEEKRLPGGRRTRVDVIRHPGAVLIVPFLDKKRMVFIRQFRPVLGAYLFELPAGTRRPGERRTACAGRELSEETGFAARRIRPLGRLHPAPGYSTETIFVYRADGLTETSAVGDADEVIATRVMTRPCVRRLFKAGRITDAKTIAALALCRWL